MEQKQVKIGSDTLHMIKTDRFRTIRIKVVIKNKIKKEDITKRNILANMLIESTKEHPTRRDLVLETENLYIASLSSGGNREGNFNNINMIMTVVNEKYSEAGMYEKSIALLSEMLFHPNIKDGAFDKDAFDFVIKSTRKAISAIKEKTEKYSIVRLLENMGDSPSSYRDFGYIEDLEKITRENLVDFYNEWMKNSYFDIYVLGDIDYAETEKYIKKYFNIVTYKHKKISPYLEAVKPRNKVQKIVERGKVRQAKLTVGCIVDEVEGFELNYVWNLYTIILGGSPDSKFFQNIREKHSVAYYVTASMLKFDHLMILRAGIDENNFDKTVKLMEQEMKEMAKGNFTEEDINKAKMIYQTALDEALDSPGALMDSFIATDLLGSDNIEVKREKIMEVTKDQIVAFAKKVHIDTIYLFTGEEQKDEKN